MSTASPDTPLALDCRQLTKTYGQRTVLHQLDLQLAAGDYVAIMDESGVGKSTLLNCLAGLDHGDAGEVTVDGKRIAFTHGHEPAAMRAAIAGGADYLVHGHTHELRDDRAAGTRIVNPGALHRAPRFTVATLEPATDTLTVIEVPA